MSKNLTQKQRIDNLRSRVDCISRQFDRVDDRLSEINSSINRKISGVCGLLDYIIIFTALIIFFMIIFKILAILCSSTKPFGLFFINLPWTYLIIATLSLCPLHKLKQKLENSKLRSY